MSAKDLIVKPITSANANRFIRRAHYSGKVVPNSQLHFGVFWADKLQGVMQFGPPMKKKPILPMVSGTKWSGMLELNRMAFSEKLPRNSESRAISVAIRLIRKNYPHIEWILSFSDGTQCGDGTIYRASGFYLVGIKKNTELRINPDTGEIVQSMQAVFHKGVKDFNKWDKLDGYQLKYIYFINKSAKDRLTIPIIPFSQIDEIGAGMYKGIKRVKQATIGTTE